MKVLEQLPEKLPAWRAEGLSLPPAAVQGPRSGAGPGRPCPCSPEGCLYHVVAFSVAASVRVLGLCCIFAYVCLALKLAVKLERTLGPDTD